MATSEHSNVQTNILEVWKILAVIAVEADLRAERKSGTHDASLGTKHLLLSDSTIRAKDRNYLL